MPSRHFKRVKAEKQNSWEMEEGNKIKNFNYLFEFEYLDNYDFVTFDWFV